MNENINIANILKDVPVGTKLWSPIFGECEFQGISCANQSPIICTHTIKEYVLGDNIHEFADFLCDGRLATCCSEDGECLLFPSKENRDWSTFKYPLKHKYFEPFQKVLVAACVSKLWEPDIYGYYDDKHKRHICMSRSAYDNDIIPYKGNEYKLGKPVK